MRTLTALVATATLAAACVAPPPRSTSAPMPRSDAWFKCESAFECVVVYDAYCQMVAVNQNYAITYQDWALAQVERIGERTVCPEPGRIGDTATCYQGTCTSRVSLERNPRPRSERGEAPPPPSE